MNAEIKKLVDQHGTQAGVALAFGVTEQAVSKWIKMGRLPRLRAEQARDRWGLSASALMGVA